ncbi:MAG TPA: PAS domain S-box protein, partial [bacterium]|nr:PAS domain S-box protein [bacterium]
MAVRKADQELLALVQRGLSQITDEERQRIDEEWFGVGWAESRQKPAHLIWLFVFAIALVSVAMTAAFGRRWLKDLPNITAARDSLLNLWLVFLSLISPLLLIASLARALEFPWTSLQTTQICIAVILWATAIFRHRIAYSVRVFLLLGMFFLLGTGGLLTYGLLGTTTITFFVFVIVATTLFGVRGSIFSITLSLLSIGSVGVAVGAGFWGYSIDTEAYSVSAMLWTLTFIGFGLWSVVATLGIGEVYRHMEDALTRQRESEEHYRTLVQSANSIILRLNHNGQITFFNEYAQKFFGFSEQEILGRDALGTIIPETESTGRDLRTMMDDLLAHPDLYVLNRNENVRRNGERVWVSWTNRAFLDERGELDEVLCIGSDVTALKAAEDALRESESFFRGVFENSMAGIMTMDRKGIVRTANPRFAEMFGYSQHEIVG